MRPLIVLIRNILAVVFVSLLNVLKLLGLRPARPAWVVFELREDPPWMPPSRRSRMVAAIRGRKMSADLRTLQARFDEVAADRRTKGVLLRLDGLSISLSKIQVLAGMARRLREAGKKVLVWTPHASSREAPFIFAGDGLYLAPAGRLELQGFAVATSSAAPALEWIGLGVTVIRRGLFKTAADTLMNEEASPELRETMGALLDDLYDMTNRSLADGRKISSGDVASLLDQAPWTGEGALKVGVIDGVCYLDELVEALESGEDLPRLPRAPEPTGEADESDAGGRTKEPSGLDSDGNRPSVAKVSPWSEYRASRLTRFEWKPVLSARRSIGLVHLDGLIVEGESKHMLGGKVVGHRSVAEVLAHVRAKRSIKALVLHIESRGGSALASDLMWHEIRRTAKEKPVVAFIDTIAASGGYYCAAGADAIVAGPYSITGSIGVISVVLETSRLASRLGVRREIFQRGRRAAVGNNARPPTEDERGSLEADVDAYYEIFLDRVAQGRSMAREEVRDRAEGRVFTGIRAKELSLVDELGGLEDAIAKAKSLAGIPMERRVPIIRLDASGAGMGSGPSGSVLGAAAGIRLDETIGDLGVDGFDLAWLGEIAASPGTAWAVLPHRLS